MVELVVESTKGAVAELKETGSTGVKLLKRLEAPVTLDLLVMLSIVAVVALKVTRAPGLVTLVDSMVTSAGALPPALYKSPEKRGDNSTTLLEILKVGGLAEVPAGRSKF